MKNSYKYGRPTSYMCRICARNMTPANWRNSWKGVRSITRVPKMGSKDDLTANKEIRVFTVDLHPICAAYRLEMWPKWTEENRVLSLDLQARCLENSLIGARSTAYLCWIWSRNMTRSKRINSSIGHLSTAYLSSNSVRNVTRTKRRILCIYGRPK